MKQTVSTVFDDLEIGITLHDPETGEIVAVNSRLEELYGYPEAELREMSVAGYTATDEGFTQADAERRIRAAADGEPQAFEWRIERADGERVWVRVRLALTGLDGEEYVIAEIQDISDRKEREAELADLHAATRQLMEVDTPEAIAEVACQTAKDVLEFRVNSVNLYDETKNALVPAAVSAGATELIGDPPVLDSGLAWEAFQDGQARIQRDLGEAEEVYNPDTEIRSEMFLPFGEYGILIVASTEVDAFDETDLSLAKILAANIESTLERTEQQQQYKRLTERISDGYYAFDDDWRVTYWNDTVADRLGIPADEIIGENFWAEFPELDGTVYETTLREAMSTQTPQSCEFYYEPADYWIELNAYPDAEGLVVISTEITDRKEQQQQLESEQAFIQQSLETLDDVFYMLDGNGVLQRWNPAFAEATGYTDKELAGSHALEFFPESDHELVSEAIGEVLETGSTVVESELVTKSGESIPHEFTGTRFTGVDGTVRGIIGIGRDVTERREQLEELKKQEQAFRQLHQTSSKSVSFEEKIADLLAFGREYMGVEQGFFTRFEDGTQRVVVGVGPNEQLQGGAEAPFSESYCRHTVDPDSESPLTVLNAAEEGWQDDPAYERFGLACYVGSKITVDGEAVGSICFADRDPTDKEFSDIQETFVELLTEWASYEIERADREKKYRRLTERISDAYYAVDTDFRFTYWNDVVADRIGVPAEEVLGQKVWEYFPDVKDTIVEEKLREAMETQQPAGCEYYYEPADYWTSLRIYPDEDGLAVISKDITDRKRQEAKLQRSNERLQEFAYILSHDLQEPLRMVSSYVDLLEMELDEHLDEETREYMAFAVDGAERMRGMIDGLLQYSRVESEGESFVETDLRSIVEEVTNSLQLVLNEANAEISVGKLPTVQADDDQIGQLLQNLISNALDHGGHGVSIAVTGKAIAEGCQVTVSDDGPGIPADRQDEVFGLFDKGSDSDGTGIGMAICERIVNRHNGDIWIDSTEGEGTSVTFTLKTDSA